MPRLDGIGPPATFFAQIGAVQRPGSRCRIEAEAGYRQASPLGRVAKIWAGFDEGNLVAGEFEYQAHPVADVGGNLSPSSIDAGKLEMNQMNDA